MRLLQSRWCVLWNARSLQGRITTWKTWNKSQKQVFRAWLHEDCIQIYFTYTFTFSCKAKPVLVYLKLSTRLKAFLDSSQIAQQLAVLFFWRAVSLSFESQLFHPEWITSCLCPVFSFISFYTYFHETKWPSCHPSNTSDNPNIQSREVLNPNSWQSQDP